MKISPNLLIAISLFCLVTYSNAFALQYEDPECFDRKLLPEIFAKSELVFAVERIGAVDKNIALYKIYKIWKGEPREKEFVLWNRDYLKNRDSQEKDGAKYVFFAQHNHTKNLQRPFTYIGAVCVSLRSISDIPEAKEQDYPALIEKLLQK